MNKRLKGTILLLAVVATLLSSTVVMAQSSGQFNFGCWGVITDGGGQRASSQYRISDSLGQVAAGTSTGASVGVRGGYIQDWTFLRPPSSTAQPAGNQILYLPFVSLKVVRRCG